MKPAIIAGFLGNPRDTKASTKAPSYVPSPATAWVGRTADSSDAMVARITVQYGRLAKSYPRGFKYACMRK